MIQIAEVLPAQPTPLWKLVQQAGVRHAVAYLPFNDTTAAENAWDIGPMTRMKQRFDAAGFELAVVESSPPMQKIRLGLDGRDEEIEAFQTLLRNMGALSIPVICYNFMAHFGWTRTRVAIPGRGGALVTGYFQEDMGEELTEYGVVPEERIWENLRYFLERVVPVAEASHVKLAMHPDDPPRSPLRGIGRIMRTVENFQRLVELVPSEVNGITLCQGNFALMTDDLPAVIRHFGQQGKIFFVHMRDVRGDRDNFVETFHDEGITDMLGCMQAYRDIGFEGVLRPDHVPTMEGDSNDTPCYSSVGRLFAIGYLTGLQQAVYGKTANAG